MRRKRPFEGWLARRCRSPWPWGWLCGLVLSWLVGPMAAAAHPADRLVCTQPLGALYARQQTTFRVWAPTARNVRLHLYRAPRGGTGRTLSMRRAPDGSWSVVVAEDCAGLYYTYTTSLHTGEVLDPYAQAVTSWQGRGIVVHDATPLVPRPQFPPQDAIIYELHLRDYGAGTYTGLSPAHLLDLGVNTVQLMPILEFANDKVHHEYGWGYDSAFFNTPDGNYSQHPDDASRVREVKQMVNNLHRHGIRVVLDIVLTHTAQVVFDRALSFEGLVPGYYFRHKPDGTLWNGSGCGNEFRSEAPMARRFVFDTLKHWVNDYGVDGFRFDLMGLMDVDTMREAARQLHAIDPNLLIYGEPWTAGTSPVDGLVKGKQKGLGIAVFNDHFRDAVRGDVFHPDQPGFIENGSHADAVRRGIMGSIDDFTESPLETINYVECHDNHTLWDRLALSAPQASDAQRQAMDRLAAALVFTSQGIPFIQSGQECLRSKGGSDNSYNLGDPVNLIPWTDLLQQHHDTFAWYAHLIKLRHSHSMFRQSTADAVRHAVAWMDTPPGTIGYVLSDVGGADSWSRAVVLFNGGATTWSTPLPAGKWTIRACGDDVVPHAADASIDVPPYSAAILGEDR